MSIIEAVKKWIATCPHMDRFTNEYVDWTDSIPDNYGIENNGDGIIKTYLDGSSLHKYDFMLLARNCTLEDSNRLANNGFCEDFVFWVEDCRRKRQYPVLEEGFTPQKIEADNGMLLYYDESATTGVYQIQIHLTYFKQGGR